MVTSAGPSPILEPIYDVPKNNQPVKLTLCERVSKIFFSLFEKISHLFSRKPSQMKKEIEPIYDVPKNNRPVKTLTLYERVSNFFTRGPSQIKLLEEKFNRETAQLRQKNEELCHYICVNVKRIEHLEDCVHFLRGEVASKEVQINSLKDTTLSLEEELYSNRTQVSQDSGFSESPPIRKETNGLLSKAKSYLENKVG